MERHYTDGTEPDILPHYTPACRGFGCLQGRGECPHPDHCRMPAEAATEIGADDDGRSPWFHSSDFFVAAIMIILACFLAGLAYGALTR